MSTSWMKRLAFSLALTSSLVLAVITTKTHAELIAFDLVNGNSQNLISYTNPFQSGFTSNSDSFQRFYAGDAVPDVLIDNSLSASDSLGIVSPSFSSFFGIVDTVNNDTANTNGVVTASWQFDISGYNNLSFAIDMAAMGDFESSDYIALNYAIDNGPQISLFEFFSNTSASQSYLMASGSSYQLNDPMMVSGGNLLAPLMLSNMWQTIIADINGSGSVMSLSVTANNDSGSEAVALSQFRISGDILAANAPLSVSEPPLLLLLLIGFLLCVRYKGFYC